MGIPVHWVPMGKWVWDEAEFFAHEGGRMILSHLKCHGGAEIYYFDHE
jgi:hypothetical protein